MKRQPPVDYVRHGAVALAIRYSPVTMLIEVIRTEEEALEAIERVDFYSSDEMRRLLKASPLNIRPSLELKGFPGVRTEEVVRFWWLFIKEPDQIIDIPRQIAKLKFRTLPIVLNLQVRLAAYDEAVKRGRV